MQLLALSNWANVGYTGYNARDNLAAYLTILAATL